MLPPPQSAGLSQVQSLVGQDAPGAMQVPSPNGEARQQTPVGATQVMAPQLTELDDGDARSDGARARSAGPARSPPRSCETCKVLPLHATSKTSVRMQTGYQRWSPRWRLR